MNQRHKIEYVKIIDLKPALYNPRQMTEKQVKDLEASIRKFGLPEPLIVNRHPKRMNTIVGGHQRVKIAQMIGLDIVPVVYVDLDEEQEKELNLRLNKNTGEWDFDALASFDTDLLLNVGWTNEELKDIFQLNEVPGGAGNTDPDDVPDPPAEPKSKLGDIYQLGRHRLMCGDSTKREDVEKLMGGERADMCFTDPPYGIKEKTDRRDRDQTFKSESLAKRKKYHPIIGDDSFGTAINAFNLINDLRIESIIYWGGNCFSFALPQTFSWIVWDKKVEEKNHDNQGDCELAWVKSNKFEKSVRIFRHVWKGMIKDSEIGEARVHPTQKPIALCEWCLDNYGDPQIILDPFGGSGSTLIACEKTGRRCRMMELDSLYVDVIISRWENYTGQKAVKL